MAPKNKTKHQVFDKLNSEEGSTHLIECTGKGLSGSGCSAWVPLWMPRKIPKLNDFTDRPFLCGYCATSEIQTLTSEVQELKEQLLGERQQNATDESSKLLSVFNSDANKQYGRRENIRKFGVRETAEEDPYEKVVEVAGKIGVTIKRVDISVCHRLASRSGLRPIIVKFVRRETKFQIMKHKKNIEKFNLTVVH